MGKARRTTTILLAGWMLAGVLVLTRCAHASELHPQTVAAFDHYVHLTESRMDDDLRDDHFLYIDSLPAERRNEIEAQVRRGDFYIEQLHTLEDGRAIHVPSGLVHHWIGIAFIPREAFSQTLHVLQDFEKYEQVYRPDIRKSELLEREGNISKTYMQLYKKSLVSVVLNANFDAEYRPLSSKRAEFRTFSTRIAEVKDPGEPDEHELPVGNDHGYLWRLNSYWRFQDRNGGVYLQIESIALSRTVPFEIAWLVDPAIHNLSKAVVANLLNATVKAVTGESAAAARFYGETSAELSTRRIFITPLSLTDRLVWRSRRDSNSRPPA